MEDNLVYYRNTTIMIFYPRYPTTSFHFNQVTSLSFLWPKAAATEAVHSVCQESQMSILQDRILGLYSTDQEEEDSPDRSLRTGPLLRKRSRRLGREEHRQTLFIAD